MNDAEETITAFARLFIKPKKVMLDSFVEVC